MGMFKVPVTLTNPKDSARTVTQEFWVDTGALYSFVPEDTLHAIGIEPKFARDFVMADGRADRRMIGEALFTIAGLKETLTCLVVFAPKGSLFLLGATAMENFCVAADPTAMQLRPITAVIGGHAAGRA